MPRHNSGPRLALNNRGVYEIRWTEQRRSKRLSTGTQSLAQAQQALAGFLSETREAERDYLTVDDVLTIYENEHVVKLSAAGRQLQCIHWLRMGLGSLHVDDLNATQITEYTKKRQRGIIGPGAQSKARRGRGGVASATVRRELNCVIAALNYCVKTKRLRPEQMPYIPLPDGGDPSDFYLTQTERQQFMACAQEFTDAADRITRGHRFAALALATAARKTAIHHLTWDLVDLDNELIRYDLLPGRRTKKRRVAVPIADELRPVLERAHAERINEYVLDHAKDSRRALETIGRYAADKHDNPRFLRVNPHSLRHTSATHMAQNRVEPFFIAGVLGDTIATVMRVYVKHNPDYLRSAVNAGGGDPAATRAAVNDAPEHSAPLRRVK